MDIEALYFKDARQWRKWLEDNYDKQQEIWLVHYKKKSKNVSLSLEDAVKEALCFGWIDSKLIRIDGEKYILKYTPRKANSVWSKINKERAEKLIEEGKMTAAGLEKIREARKRGLWKDAYTSKIGDKIPPDLNEALLRDDNAWTNFQKFANSYRNMYIGWINAARTDKTRLKRIEEVVRRSSQNRKPGTE